MDEIGPVQYLVVAFPGNKFTGDIAPALADQVEAGTIRLIDVAFVGKDDAGEVVAFELTDLDPEVREGLERLGASESGLFNEDDVLGVADELEPGSSAALLLWEDVWAKDVLAAMKAADGVLLASGRIPHEVVTAAREWVAAQA
jgi:Family of unknown function (DUF6325)